MSCPFLKEARVKYCEKSAFRKMIRIAGNVAQETCSTPRYKQCAVHQRHAEGSEDAQCPYLRESLAQYCATAAVPRLIPYHEPRMSRCGDDSYRYCDVFLDTASAPNALPRGTGDRQNRMVGGMRVPTRLYYAKNHMWLDIAEGGTCHMGLDAFLTRVLGSVERVTFLRQTGAHRPGAVVTVRGVDLAVIFPNPILLTASNLYLRANPAKLTADPYGMGWLFQGVHLPGQAPVTSGLICGDGIVPWVERDIGRMSAFLGECWVARRGGCVMNDGGVFSADVLAQLSREETVRLFHEFFWGWEPGSC